MVPGSPPKRHLPLVMPHVTVSCTASRCPLPVKSALLRVRSASYWLVVEKPPHNQQFLTLSNLHMSHGTAARLVTSVVYKVLAQPSLTPTLGGAVYEVLCTPCHTQQQPLAPHGPCHAWIPASKSSRPRVQPPPPAAHTSGPVVPGSRASDCCGHPHWVGTTEDHCVGHPSHNRDSP